MNPHQVSQSVNAALVEQMRRTRPVEGYDTELSEELRRLYEGDADHAPAFRFVSPPYVERLRYYAQGEHSNLAQLVAEGALEPETANLFARYFGQHKPEDVTLYAHQADAARAIAAGKNVMVCTGTGSGKTESFLIPVINGIIKERKECRERNIAYTPGVRAMILYPMNALVNDQLLRLRRLLKLAGDTVDYAGDITFGYYTGEFDSQPSEASRWVKRLKDDKTDEAYFSSPEEASRCYHAYLSEDETADNEYVKRTWWTDHEHGPADILITNYSMLERLLLDPDKSAIFSPEPQTWKYIVLDEAHTYTGSLGTEISWLLRRLIDRVSEGGITAQDNGEAQRRIQFLATSATISTGEDAEQQALDFAQDIFRCRDRRTQDECPEANGNFIVLQGEHYRADWESDDARQRPCGSYARLLDEEGIDLGEYLAGSHLEQLRPIESSLFAQTKWLHQAQSWLRRFDYLEQFLKRENPTEAALGDLIALSTCLEALGMEDQDISLRRNSSLDSLQSLLLFYQGQEPEAFRQKLRNISGERLNSSVEARKSSILKFCEQKEDVVKLRSLSLLPILAQLLLSLQEEYNKAEDLDVEVARWKFEWTNAFTELLKRGAEEVRAMRERIRGLRGRIAEKWAELLDMKAEERSAQAIVTDYILTHRELGVMAEILKAGHAKEEDLCREGFGDETAEFEAFIQLLTLTQDEALPNKAPLMDLRYHQLVNRIEGAAVWFDEQNHLHLVLNEEAENTVIRAADDKEYQLYELGQCYSCGHPYLMLYASGAMESGKMPAMGETVYRFGGTGLLLHAFARCCEGEEAEYWLDAQRRKVYGHKASGGLIPLRLHAAASQTEAQKTAQNAAISNIRECPYCGKKSQTSTTYGIIGPYNTGSDFSRTTVIDCLVRSADPEFGIDPRKHPQHGRKLLTFSDSRSQAAAIPVEYENSAEERHVLRLLMECVQELEETDPRKALNKLVEFCTGKSRDEKSDVPEKYDVSKDMDLNCLFVIRTNPNFPPEHAAPLEESLAKRLSNSPLLLMPGFTERLHKAGGDHLLQKEYLSVSDGRTGAQEVNDFSEGAAALLTMFSLLRTPGRYCAVKGPEAPLKVYSWKHESLKENNSDWKQFKTFCRDDDAAEKAFQTVYTDIFLSVKGSYGGFDHANDWNADTAASADGKGLSCRKDEFYDKKEEVVLSLISGGLQKQTNREAAKTLLRYLRDSILIDGKIDLYDVRLELTPTGREKLARDPNLVTVFYEADEHSAQLAKETKRLYQQKFTEGKINILSCTTTFEMGVDVGSLNCVLLCDMPPSVASYRQRAGRAGRRAGSSAYVLTLATGRAHDAHFSQHPEDMFFGEVTPPVIYSHNESFRAKHLRAVALQLFLRSLKAENAQRLWKLSGHFFLNTGVGDRRRVSCISDLPAWVEEHRDEVQERCLAIAGGLLDYSVADDLCLQITGLSNGLDRYKNRLPSFDETQSYLELSGPFLPNPDNKGDYNEANPWKASAARRYELEIQTAGGGKIPADIMDSRKGKSVDSYCRRMAYAQTVDVLARFRVLSRYGFPCEVITLRLAKEDESRLDKVDLSRDIKQGLYEYAPGQVVLANKRKYESKSPIWLGSYRGKGKKEQLDIEEDKQFLACTQKQCLCVMYDEGDDGLPKCPQCGAPMQRITASRPDAFQAERSRKASAVPLNVHPPRRCFYIGHRSETWDIDGTRAQASSSDSREIMYLNMLSKDFKRGDENIDALYYAFRTDIVMLSLNPEASPLPDNPCWNSDVHRSRAWRSATQAIVKALAKVLHVSPLDIGALTTEIDKIPHIVLFDNTASGSGAMLRLIKGKTEEETQQGNTCVELTKRILTEALALCKSCECFSLRDAHQGIVMTHHECLMAREESSRVEAVQEYHSCYKCLKSYSNQTEHDILDAHDAAFILQHMLGSDESPEACSPQPQPPAEPFPKPEVEHPVSPLPPCPPPADQASSGREKPRATREQLQFVRDLKLRRLGPFPACRVIRNGKETEMRAIYASKTHIYLSLPGPESNAEKFEFYQLILN